MKQQYTQAEASAEAYLLSVADNCMRSATEAEATTKMSVVQALAAIYEAMASYVKQYEAAATQCQFVGFWGKSVEQAYEGIIKQVIAQDPKLQHTDRHKQHFDPHLSAYAQGANSIPAFMEFLDSNRATLLHPMVSTLWDSAARKFHQEHQGNCNAGGGCPSTSCGAKQIMAAVAAKQGVRDVVQQ